MDVDLGEAKKISSFLPRTQTESNKEETKDDATEDEATEDDATEDEATEDDATEDEATEDDNPHKLEVNHIVAFEEVVTWFDANVNICIRCGKYFIVDEFGRYAKKEKCIYHPEKEWIGIPGHYEPDPYFECCKKKLNAKGCSDAEYHVHVSNKWKNRTGYRQTLPCPPVPDGDYGVYALDTEMVYTQVGLELARVTVVDCNNEVVYDTFVRPDTKVIDFNTRFSGITAKDMDGVTTTIRDVQAVLLRLFAEETILIGHSLECDLTAVKVILNFMTFSY
eukprot:XP_019924660.1 PREDICTED: RNA exonuclease 1 homolog [Crassostrea gigas]